MQQQVVVQLRSTAWQATERLSVSRQTQALCAVLPCQASMYSYSWTGAIELAGLILQPMLTTQRNHLHIHFKNLSIQNSNAKELAVGATAHTLPSHPLQRPAELLGIGSYSTVCTSRVNDISWRRLLLILACNTFSAQEAAGHHA